MISNKLDEALTILQEECGETVQVCSKIRRFGIDNTEYKDKRKWLTQELGDIFAMIEILVDLGVVSTLELTEAKLAKKEKLKTYSNLFND